jgi:hypothetical protein
MQGMVMEEEVEEAEEGQEERMSEEKEKGDGRV